MKKDTEVTSQAHGWCFISPPGSTALTALLSLESHWPKSCLCVKSADWCLFDVECVYWNEEEASISIRTLVGK